MRRFIQVISSVGYLLLNVQAVSAGEAQATLADRFYAKAEEIFEKATVVHYRHLHEDAAAQVSCTNQGYCCETDCSGFVGYVIESVAPKHYAFIANMTARSHPHAAVYAQFFKELPNHLRQNGWLKVGNWPDLKRGDIVAWARPPRESDVYHKPDHTGHVMIVIDPPGKIKEEIVAGLPIRFVEVYVLDSSGVTHFSPESLPPLAHQSERDGLGKGVIRLIVDGQNKVQGYWEGAFSQTKHKPIVRPTYASVIGFGRICPLTESRP